MSQILLPESVIENMRVERSLHFASDGYVKDFNRRLKEIDPHLSLAFAGDRAEGSGIQPGRWHIQRKNPQRPDIPTTFWTISTNGIGNPGGFRDPDQGVIDELHRNDLWKNGGVEKLKRAREERERREARERANQREARRDELAVNIKAVTNPGIQFGDGKWTAKAKGRRGRRITD